MQTISPEPERDLQAARAEPPNPAARRGGGFALRALWLVVILALLAGGYAWYEQRSATQSLQSDVAQRLQAADAAVAQARARESDLANALREAQAKLALLEARTSEFQSQQASLEALYRDLAPSRDELALSEVEQILVLASQQLVLVATCRRRSPDCRSPMPSWPVSIVRRSRRRGARSRATWIA